MHWWICFSDDSLFKLSLLLSAQYEDITELDPHNEPTDEDNVAEMNMTFFLYIIKDVLEFAGFYPTTTPAR